MNKLEIIKKYIRVNEVGKAQNLIFKNIADSNISILEKREIIGELNNYKFIFDLITRDIKSIQNMETGEFLRTSM